MEDTCHNLIKHKLKTTAKIFEASSFYKRWKEGQPGKRLITSNDFGRLSRKPFDWTSQIHPREGEEFRGSFLQQKPTTCSDQLTPIVHIDKMITSTWTRKASGQARFSLLTFEGLRGKKGVQENMGFGVLLSVQVHNLTHFDFDCARADDPGLVQDFCMEKYKVNMMTDMPDVGLTSM